MNLADLGQGYHLVPLSDHCRGRRGRNYRARPEQLAAQRIKRMGAYDPIALQATAILRDILRAERA
jgi:hypothetical protein